MSGTKKFINDTGKAIKVRIFVRKGADPLDGNSGKEGFTLAPGEAKIITYGEDTGDVFLNGIRVFWEDDGADCAYMLNVEKRGNWLDDTLNTNNVITINSADTGKISGSNEGATDEETGTQYFKLTSMFLESQNLFLEGNGGLSSENTLDGAAFMSPQVNASGTIWKMIPLDGEYFQLTTLFMEDKNVVLEGNGGLDSQNTLGGAAFLSPQTNASGTMWKKIPLSNGYFQLTSRFLEDQGLVLEGNGGFSSENTLHGAAFMSGQTNASGTMWKMVPVKI